MREGRKDLAFLNCWQQLWKINAHATHPIPDPFFGVDAIISPIISFAPARARLSIVRRSKGRFLLLLLLFLRLLLLLPYFCNGIFSLIIDRCTKSNKEKLSTTNEERNECENGGRADIWLLSPHLIGERSAGLTAVPARPPALALWKEQLLLRAADNFHE